MQAQALSPWRAASTSPPRPSRPCSSSRLASHTPARLHITAALSVRPKSQAARAPRPSSTPEIPNATVIDGQAASGVLCLAGPAALMTLAGPASALQADMVHLQPLNPAIGEVSAVLEAGVLLLYLGGLLSLLAFGTFLVVRQVLVRRELENAAKELQERVRSGQASSEEYFELGAVMLRKKFFTLANKYLLQAVQKWEGDEQELAQVHNALGFSYFSEEKWDKAVAEYEKAVKLQPAYVTAWNNMADAFEKKKDWQRALKAYESSLMYDPSNRVANERREEVKRKVSQYTF